VEQSRITGLVRRKLSYVALVLAVFSFVAKPAFAQETVFGPKDLKLGWFRIHLSFHKFTVEEPGEGTITISKNTPDKKIREGFARLNGKWIPLQSFLSGNTTVFEKSVNLRSCNYLFVLLRGDRGASISLELRKRSLTPPPEVNFSVYPSAIKLGDSCELSWNVANAETVEIEPDIGTVEASGSLAVSPNETTTYIIKAEGKGGTATSGLTVTVYQPPTVTLHADPETVTYGETTMLSWSSTHASQVVIDQNIGEVSTEGSLEIKPDRTTTYTISATGPGGSKQAQIVVTVKVNVEPQPEGSFGKHYEDLIPLDATVEAYNPRRFSVITGLVHDVDGLPIGDVSITVHDHLEYGTSFTDGEGRFSIPVEGGGTNTVVYQKEGLITAHRKVYVPWNDIAIAETIQMVAQDPAATTISFDGNPDTTVTHQSTEVSDEFGTRSCTMVFTGDNQAYEVDAQGTVIRELGEITTRATEFTSPESMPAILPPTSAYTYCAELSVDGVARVKFAQPVIMWVDNFLGFDVGMAAPVGFYDRDRGVWVPEKNGRVVKLLDTDTDGVVDALDATGDDVPDDLNSSGSFTDEVKGLEDAQRYQPEATFWRIALEHFSPHDINWARAIIECYTPLVPQGPENSISPNPDGEASADEAKPEEQIALPNDTDCLNSYVKKRNRIFHEDIPIPGTDLALHYASNRVEGYRHGISVPASGETVPDGLKRIIVKVEVAGRVFEQVLAPLPNQKAEFVWDGLDQLGRRISSTVTAKVAIGFVYEAVYTVPPDLEIAFAMVGEVLTPIMTREEITLWKKSEISVPIPPIKSKGLMAEGWSLSRNYYVNPADPSILYKGDGLLNTATLNIITTVAGDGGYGFSGDGGPATEAQLAYPYRVAVDGAGNLYIADNDNHRIRKVDANGIITTVAGNGSSGFSGDEGPATNARLYWPYGVAVDSAGNLYIADTYNYRIRKVDDSGIITTVAGNGSYGFSGDGGPATEAQLRNPEGIAVDSAGNLYIVDDWNSSIRKVDTGGIITTVAGDGSYGFSGDGGPATEAQLYLPWAMAVDSAGNLYIADTRNQRIRKVDASGLITTVAGDGSYGFSGDGGPATEAQLAYPYGVAVDSAGNLYIADTRNQRIRKVDTGGIITTVAGTVSDGFSGDGGLATEAQLRYPSGVAVDSGGNLYIADQANHRIRKVAPPAIFAYSMGTGDILFAENTGIGHIMHGSGRHKKSIDLDTGITLYEFGYDQDDQLVSITDRFGNQTTIARDGNGVPTAITSPDGITTTLTIDSNNHLTRITYPDGSYYGFEYTADGLMTAEIEPEGNRFEHFFDALGRLTDVTDQEGGHWNYSKTALANGDIRAEVTTGEGDLTAYLDHYDSAGSFSSTITDPTGSVTSYSQSGDGLTVNKSLPCGMDLHFEYGIDSEYKFKFVKQMMESTPLGLVKTTSRGKTYQDTDSDETPDRITETVTVNGKTTTLVTDTLQGKKTITSPGGRTVTSSYEPNTLLTTGLTISGLHDTIYGYDISGRLTSIATNNRQTAFAYNAQGQLSSITDPENHTTTYTYDAVGHITGISRPDTSSVAFTYDKNGNMTVLTNPANISHGFGYNKVNLNSSYTAPLSGSYSYVYDRDRRLREINYPSGKQITNIYGSGRLEQVQTPEGNVDFTYLCGSKVDTITKGAEAISYGYDGSLVTAENLSGTLNEFLTYGYNSDFNDTSFTYAGGTVLYTYDNDGLLTGVGNFTISRNSGNGLPESVAGGALGLSRTFNGYGEVEAQDFSVGSLGVNSWSLSRDNTGRIVAKTETVEGVTSNYLYTYDSMGRLLTTTKDGNLVEEYHYDSVGTRTYEMNSLRGIVGRTFTYDDEDHLLTVEDATYQCDLDGYLTTKTVGTEAPYEVTSYVYSSRGELLSLTLPDGTAIEYVHDPLGRRIAKKVNGVITEKYLWQGLTRLLAVYDVADNLIMRFLYADSRMPVAVEKGSAVYYLSYDQVGSLRAVADSSGNVVKRIDYDLFGNVITDTNTSFNIPFGFAGGLHDQDTGLVRFGFRDYDPDTGRWTAKDPIGFSGGDIDLYGYCLNDPVNWVDPYGFSAAGDVYRGIITAVTEGTKGAAYSVVHASKDIAQLAIEGDPYVKTVLGIAAVSEVVPLACAAGYYAVPAATAATTATLTNPAAIEFASDFLQGAIPGSAPPPTIGGGLGTAANILYNKLF